MDRNIVMPEDVDRHAARARAAARGRLDEAAEADPALASVRAQTADTLVDAASTSAVPSPDTYFDRVLKCLPVEVIGAYTVLAAAAVAAFEGSTRRWWLGVLLVLGIVAAPALAVRLHLIRRPSQLLLVPVAFVVFVAGQGGWFATWSWWNAFYALFAAVSFGVIVALLPFGPLPEPADPTDPADPAEPTVRARPVAPRRPNALTSFFGGLRTKAPKRPPAPQRDQPIGPPPGQPSSGDDPTRPVPPVAPVIPPTRRP